MATTQNIHEEIESWLAAAVHDQLSPEERVQFEEHLAGCTSCRTLYKEELAMSNMIATTLNFAKPDFGFEQRILSNFRRTIPARDGIGLLFVRLFRSRAMRIAGVAGTLLLLILLGTWLTFPRQLAYLENEELALNAVTAPADDSLGGLRAKLAGREAATWSKSTPVEGMRQLPSFIGKASTENDSEGPRESAKGRRIVTGSHFPTAETESALPVTVYSAEAKTKAGSPAPPPSEDEPQMAAYEAPENPEPAEQPVAPMSESDRKLIRTAEVELEVLKFDDAVQKVTALVTAEKGYIATSSSEKQENGKLRGEIVVKVPPPSLQGFLTALRGLGEVKNQKLGTEDVTKNYFDTDARLKNSRVLEERLVEMVKKSTGKVSDLLQVEKELARVREQIETMQGELKYMDAQVQFATVTITLSEKDMDAAAAFRLKRSATLALFSAEVEKTFGEVKSAIAGTKAQVASSGLDRDAAGEVTAHLVLLLPPDEADAMIARIKGMGRVQSYKESTTREAQGGSETSDTAKDKVDKVELELTISRNAREPALQTTSLNILTKDVTEKLARLKENAAKIGAEVRSSSFTRNVGGDEYANVSLRVEMKKYPALVSSLDQLGKVKDVSISREDRRGLTNEETAPADINMIVYSEGSIISDESGIFATIRRTLTQGALALMWSLRMIGVAIAFLAPWIGALALVIWVRRKIKHARANRQTKNDTAAL